MPGTPPTEDRHPPPAPPNQQHTGAEGTRPNGHHRELPPVTVTVILPEHPPHLTNAAAAALLAFLQAERAHATRSRPPADTP